MLFFLSFCAQRTRHIALQAIGEAGVRLILRDYARQEYIVSQQPDELFTVMPGFDDIRTTLDDIPIDPVAIYLMIFLINKNYSSSIF